MQVIIPSSPTSSRQSLCALTALLSVLSTSCAWPKTAPLDTDATKAKSAAATAPCASGAPRTTGTALADAAAPPWPARAALSVMTWNLDWFQDPNQGPADDRAQYNAVREILTEVGADLIALEEVASEAAFEELVHDLANHSGVLSGYAWTQKTALLWNKALFELDYARAVSGLDDAGRPPLEVSLIRKRDAERLLVVVIHAKAQAAAADHDQRLRFAQGLKAHLDTVHAQTPLIVLGDFNDRLIGSITTGAASPYQSFVDDPAYDAPTRSLDAKSDAATSYAWGATIDHIVVSDELAPSVEQASVRVLREPLTASYANYTTTVSDHFPVTLLLDF